MKKLILMCLMLSSSAWGAEFKAGVARRLITPELPIWLSGYAARTKPADGVILDLWAKALAVEDSQGRRVVIVTTDLIGLPREVSDVVAARARTLFGLERSQLLLSSSHTHSGPAVWPNLHIIFNFTAEDEQRAERYAKKLADDLVGVIGDAIRDLSPAQISSGHGSSGFAVNRREPAQERVKIGVNPKGPVDHDVPVITIAAPDGKLRAILFGYACHNTTLGGDFYKVSGDYAGFAQAELERAHPGSTAMFMILCGADQNPNPRGTLDLARQHGISLAESVERVLSTGLSPVQPPLRTAYGRAKLAFAPRTRAAFEEEARNPDLFRQRRAKLMLKAMDEGKPERTIDCPVQVVRFGNDLTMVALGDEVVVDYALRLKKEYPKENLIVAGYCNEVMCYIPSRRVLKEGGYEPVDSMIYYGHPGPFREDVEENLVGTIHRVLRRAGVN